MGVSANDDIEAEAERRAEVERVEIVRRYTDKTTKTDDNWILDAKAKIYRVTDRYGFLHENELDALSPAENRRKLVEVKRNDKWLKMVKHWDKYESADKNKLRKRVYKGIPQRLRGDVWKLLLKVEQYTSKHLDVYERTKNVALRTSPDIRQIDVDVLRTYRDHIMFRERYSVKQQQLFNVLVAYSMYNTEVGYCQGMSEIAALLLMFMSEEEAFWGLHSLLYCERHRMHGFFIPGFPKLLRFQAHHDKILSKFMPRLKKHLDSNEIHASFYTMKWFFQCFLDRSPFPLTLRIWDIYMLEGERLLTAMSYTTLKLHKAAIKKRDMEGIVTFLQQLANDFIVDHDVAIEQLKLCMSELKRSGMDLPPPAKEEEFPKKKFGVNISIKPAELVKSNQAERQPAEAPLQTTRISTIKPTDERRSGVRRSSTDSGVTGESSSNETATKKQQQQQQKSRSHRRSRSSDHLKQQHQNNNNRRDSGGGRNISNRDSRNISPDAAIHTRSSRKDVIKWKKISGNFPNTFDQFPVEKQWQQQQQQQQQQRYHDDSAAPAAARTRTRPTSIYDNVESNGDDYPSGGLRGAYLQLQTNPNEEDMYEMNFQAAIEEVGITTLPPSSPVVHPHNHLPQHHDDNHLPLITNKFPVPSHILPDDLLAASSPPSNHHHHHRPSHHQRQQRHHREVTKSPSPPQNHYQHSSSNHNSGSSNNNNNRFYQTENSRRKKRSPNKPAATMTTRYSGDYLTSPDKSYRYETARR